MYRVHTVRVFGLAFSFFLVFATAQLRADARPTRAQYREASKWVRDAKRARANKKYKKAARLYRRADRLAPRRANKLAIGQMLAALGDLVQAVGYARKAATAKPVRVHERGIQRRAADLVLDLEERIPTLTIKVRGHGASDARVTVDGNEFETADGAVQFNPGSYQIAVEAKGAKPQLKTVELAEGADETVTLNLQSTKSVSKKEVEDKSEPAKPMGYAPAVISWVLAAGGLGVGIGLGVSAVQTTAAIEI